MKSHATIRRLLIRTVVGLAASVACVLAFLPWAGAAHDDVTLSVDVDAPLQATLLPRVIVSASASRPGHVSMRVDDEAPLAVTLLPTARVGAHR